MVIVWVVKRKSSPSYQTPLQYLFRSRSNHIFGRPKVSSQGQENRPKSLYRPRPSRSWGRPEGRKWFPGPGNTFEHLFFELVQVAFLSVRRQKMSSHCQTTPWNISFSSSPKVAFGSDWRQKMSSYGPVTPRNVASSNSSNQHFGTVIRQKIVHRHVRNQKYRFFEVTQVAFWDSKKVEIISTPWNIVFSY
jgi:hypothetical protein